MARGAAVALAAQGLHFGEEYLTGFHRRFPALTGLEPWSDAFFLLFNSAWLIAWAVALRTAYRGAVPVWASALLWFLALAAVANGIAHPLLAFAAMGYFPGLVTSVPLGLAGAALVLRLSRPESK